MKAFLTILLLFVAKFAFNQLNEPDTITTEISSPYSAEELERLREKEYDTINGREFYPNSTSIYDEYIKTGENTYSKPTYYKYTSKKIYNLNQNDYLLTEFFKLPFRKDDSTIIEADTALINRYYKYTETPFYLPYHIFFNPIESYIHTFTYGRQDSYFFLNQLGINHRDELPWFRRNFPSSFRFYADTNDISFYENQTLLNLDSTFKVPLDKYLTPFYFRKTEVTNAEYREFVHYVRDSIARRMLSDENPEDGVWIFHSEGYDESCKPLCWDKNIEWNNENDGTDEILSGLFYPETQRFYKRRKIDTRKLLYDYIDDSGKRVIINVYPDTMCWMKHPAPYMGPQTNMYFWHPAYDNHPVVGISYHQAKAFCDWKTKVFNGEFYHIKHQKLPFKVKIDLPTEAQWEMATTRQRYKKGNRIHELYPEPFFRLCDKSWVCDLSLLHEDIQHYDSTQFYNNNWYYTRRADMIHSERNNYEYIYNGLKDKGMDFNYLNLFTKKTVPTKIHKWKDIYHLHDNVSEWLLESFQENWVPVYEKHKQQMESMKGKDAEIMLEMEEYYNSKNDKQGHLVRGGNWYDQRPQVLNGYNAEGFNAKTFVHPDSSYATLGFRYSVNIILE